MWVESFTESPVLCLRVSTSPGLFNNNNIRVFSLKSLWSTVCGSSRVGEVGGGGYVWVAEQF